MQLQSLISSRLKVLGHFNPNGIDIKDEGRFRSVVIWLEDHKIRYYSIEQRKSLQDVQSKSWELTFKTYLTKLGCDVSKFDSPEKKLIWLLNHAIKVDYLKTYGGVRSDKASNSTKVNPLLNYDVSSKEFQDLVNRLASVLKIQNHPDPLVTLESSCALIIKSHSPSKDAKKGQMVDLSEHSIGVFSDSKSGLNEALKILRLLHIQELREMQDEINEAIESIQKLTANPKTDTSLGKVGR